MFISPVTLSVSMQEKNHFQPCQREILMYRMTDCLRQTVEEEQILGKEDREMQGGEKKR